MFDLNSLRKNFAIAKAKESEELSKTILVDFMYYHKMASEITEAMLEEFGHCDTVKTMDDYVNVPKGTSQYFRALLAVRCETSRIPAIMVVVGRQDSNTLNWIKTYDKRGIDTWYLDSDTLELKSGTKFIEDYDPDLTLDYLIHIRYAADRPELESIAEAYAAALGWTFSNSVKDYDTNIATFNNLREYDILPYAGPKGDYGFAENVYLFNGNYCEAQQVTGKVTITPSRKTTMLAGRGVPISELQDFKEFIMAAYQNDCVQDILEPDYAICSCGYPVRTIGETAEDGFCPYCDKPIEDYVQRIFVEYQDQADPEDDDSFIDDYDVSNSDDEDVAL